MKNVLLSALFTLISSLAFAYPVVPNPDQTTGALCSTHDRDFHGFRYKAKIPYCQRNVNKDDRNKIYNAYGIPKNCRDRYTVDHFYPLSIGGNNSYKNLWPEHRNVKHLRFDLEQEVFDKVSGDQMTQEEALSIIKEAKLNPPVDQLPASNDPCDQPEMIQKIIQQFYEI